MKSISKVAGTALLLAGMGGVLLAQTENCIPDFNCSVSAPEIDGASAGSALALLGGALLLIRSRRK